VYVSDNRPITPSDIARGINDLFDRHGPMPMTADMGDCLFTAMEIEHTALAAPGYYAGMGFGVPAGIGVAATGLRPLSLVGDGAFQMTGWELGNCRRYGLDPIVVLFNNCSWEMLRTFQPESKLRRSAAGSAAASRGTRRKAGRRMEKVRISGIRDQGLGAGDDDGGREVTVTTCWPRGRNSTGVTAAGAPSIWRADGARSRTAMARAADS